MAGEAIIPQMEVGSFATALAVTPGKREKCISFSVGKKKMYHVGIVFYESLLSCLRAWSCGLPWAISCVWHWMEKSFRFLCISQSYPEPELPCNAQQLYPEWELGDGQERSCSREGENMASHYVDWHCLVFFLLLARGLEASASPSSFSLSLHSVPQISLHNPWGW